MTVKQDKTTKWPWDATRIVARKESLKERREFITWIFLPSDLQRRMWRSLELIVGGQALMAWRPKDLTSNKNYLSP